MVRAFAHGAMGCRIDPSWGRQSNHGEICEAKGAKPRSFCSIGRKGSKDVALW